MAPIDECIICGFLCNGSSSILYSILPAFIIDTTFKASASTSSLNHPVGFAWAARMTNLPSLRHLARNSVTATSMSSSLQNGRPKALLSACTNKEQRHLSLHVVCQSSHKIAVKRRECRTGLLAASQSSLRTPHLRYPLLVHALVRERHQRSRDRWRWRRSRQKFRLLPPSLLFLLPRRSADHLHLLGAVRPVSCVWRSHSATYDVGQYAHTIKHQRAQTTCTRSEATTGHLPNRLLEISTCRRASSMVVDHARADSLDLLCP